MTQTMATSSKYRMTISRLTIDKLGVRLYDKVSAVLAELVANSYDADATEVKIYAPVGEYLASKQGNQISDKGYEIQVEDNGIGMTPDQINDFYLKVGAERRKDPRRGSRSPKYNRKVMGRKGVGKLAPFGICENIEIISAGGKKQKGTDSQGKNNSGYLTAHLILDRRQILTDTEIDYSPEVGEFDETVSRETGTILKLHTFAYRQVPKMDDLERQLAQRFGIESSNWKIELIDTLKDEDDPTRSRFVGKFQIEKMDGTEIRFEKQGDNYYVAIGPDGNILEGITAGFDYDGEFYPVTGWVAYAKESYKDDLMAGIRIYCNDKIATQTSVFNLPAGFTGEHSIRSYLVGELRADWLDVDEDLIQTDRRDILWSHELGQAFETWGRAVVKRVGTWARDPMKKKTWELFKENSNIEQVISEAFPRSDQDALRDKAMGFAKMVGQRLREDEVNDKEYVHDLVDMTLLLGPRITLDETLRDAADAGNSALGVLTAILKTARIAELASFGKIADDRIRVIARIEELKDTPGTLEGVFQELIAEAPWLIDPQWSPITANQAFSTLKNEFQKYYEKSTGESIHLNDFSDPSKRIDFVLSNQDRVLQIIEIKRPAHSLENEEMDRLNRYVELMREFLNDDAHKEFKKLFDSIHVTLVCDSLGLSGVHKTAFEGLENDETLTWIDWTTFLLRTRKMHEEFLNEAERQKKLATIQDNVTT